MTKHQPKKQQSKGQRETEKESLVAESQKRKDQGVLPGITEIVFKALNTLKVRRGETLPTFTNSPTYL